MKKILAITLASAAASALVYYLYDKKKFTETFDKIKDTAKDLYGKYANKASEEAEMAGIPGNMAM